MHTGSTGKALTMPKNSTVMHNYNIRPRSKKFDWVFDYTLLTHYFVPITPAHTFLITLL